MSTSADADIQRTFGQYNRRYFGGKLPRIPVIRSLAFARKIEKKLGYKILAACINKDFIVLKPKINKWHMALLHEMVHLKLMCTGKTRAKHGKLFQREMLRLAKMGAFNAYW